MNENRLIGTSWEVAARILAALAQALGRRRPGALGATTLLVVVALAAGCASDGSSAGLEECLVQSGETVTIEDHEGDRVVLEEGFPLTLGPRSAGRDARWAAVPGPGGHGRWLSPEADDAVSCVSHDLVEEITESRVALCEPLLGLDPDVDSWVDLRVGRIDAGATVESRYSDGGPVGADDEPWMRVVGDTSPLGGVITTRFAVAVASDNC